VIVSITTPASLRAQDVAPVNDLPNPYETVRNWGSLPDGRAWGSVPAVQIDPDGRSLWVLDRCGTQSWQSAGISSCAGQDLPPVMKLDTSTGELMLAFGSGMFVFPHALHVDPAGNVWVADLRTATSEELARFPSAAGRGHVVVKLSPRGDHRFSVLAQLQNRLQQVFRSNRRHAPDHSFRLLRIPIGDTVYPESQRACLEIRWDRATLRNQIRQSQTGR
jgi:hypothetical protein